MNLAMESLLLDDFETAVDALQTAITLCDQRGQTQLADVYRKDLAALARGERLKSYAFVDASPRFQSPKFTGRQPDLNWLVAGPVVHGLVVASPWDSVQ